jgi:hypothetical protein
VLELRRHLILAAATVSLISGCGSDRHPAATATDPTAGREWVDNAARLVQQLQQDITMSAAGGANLASARRAVGDPDTVYLLLVAYGDFADCTREVAAAGTPGAKGKQAAGLVIAACRPLQQSARLFERAMQRNDPRALLEATRISARAAPILVHALAELETLR